MYRLIYESRCKAGKLELKIIYFATDTYTVMLRLTDYSLLFLLLVSTSCLQGTANLETFNTDVSKNEKEQVGILVSDQEDRAGVFSLKTNNGILTHKDIFPNDKPVLLGLPL